MSAVAPDPDIAAAAAQLRQQAQEAEAPQVDEYGQRVVPGFTSDPQVVEALAPNPDPAGAQEAAQSHTEASEQDAVPSFEADTSGIEDLLDMPVDVEVDEEPTFADDDEEPEDFEMDPKVAKRLRQLEKKNQWLEEQRIKAGQKNWVQEAKRRFPLAAQALDESFTPKSRTEALREAQRIHGLVEKAASPFLSQIKEAREQAAADAKQEARLHAQKAYGKPMVGPPEPAIEQALRQEEEDRLDRRNYKSLHDLLQAQFRAGKRSI